jgi:hypothetical protein
MAPASKHLAVSQPDHVTRATTPRGTCTAAEGLDAETFRGFQLKGELFLLTSLFIEPEGPRNFEIENICVRRRIRTKNLLVYQAARLAEGSVSPACGFPVRRVPMYAAILREPRRPLYP